MALELTVPVVTSHCAKAQTQTHTPLCQASCMRLTLNIYLYTFSLLLFFSTHTVIVPSETPMSIVCGSHLSFPLTLTTYLYIFISLSLYFSHTVIISTIKQPAAASTQLFWYIKEELSGKNKLYFS